MGMRQRLVALVLVTVAPLVALLVWDAFEGAQLGNRARRSFRAAVGPARCGAASEQAQRSDHSLGGHALDPGDHGRGGDACRDQVTRLAEHHPSFNTVGVLRLDGLVVCHNLLPGPRMVGHKDLLEDAFRPDAPDIFVSHYLHGPVSGLPVIFVARPLRSKTGEKVGLVYVSIDLAGFSALAKSIAGAGDGRTVTVIEPSTGIVLARSGSGAPIGAVFPDQEVIAAIRAHPRGGAVEGVVDGTDTIFGFAPLPGAETSGAMVAVGMPRSVVLAEVSRQNRLSFELALGAIVLAIGTAWALAYLTQVRPTERLADVARRIGEGDLSARAELDGWQAPEFQFLSKTLDDMANQLEQANTALSASEARFRLVAQNTADLVTQLDANGRRVFASPASVDLLGYQPEELLGGSPLDQVHPEDRETLSSALQALSNGEAVPPLQYRMRRRDGTYVWVETQGRPLGPNQGVILAVRDITMRKLVEDQLAEASRNLMLLATTDGLTGLHNRRSFDETLAKEYARCAREQKPMALLLMDIDHFKKFNDCYGHQEGDDCLKLISRQLQQHTRRPADFAARYGGEEFAVILPATNEAGASHFAEKCRKAIEDLRVPHRGSPLGIVTVSFGGACEVPAHGSVEELLRKADKALYQAKSAGRNRVVVVEETAPSAIRPALRA